MSSDDEFFGPRYAPDPTLNPASPDASNREAAAPIRAYDPDVPWGRRPDGTPRTHMEYWIALRRRMRDRFGPPVLDDLFSPPVRAAIYEGPLETAHDRLKEALKLDPLYPDLMHLKEKDESSNLMCGASGPIRAQSASDGFPRRPIRAPTARP